MARPKDYKPRGGNPLVVVECTGCGLRFPSGAKSHTRCPECGRNLRVHRSARHRAPVVRTPPPENTAPASVRQDPGFAPVAATVPAPVLLPAVRPAGDDDDETYIYDEHGGLVPAEWTFDGQLVAASPVPVDYAAELAARAWAIEPHGTAVCELVQLRPPGWEFGAEPLPCLRRASRFIPGGVICDSCYDALAMPLGG